MKILMALLKILVYLFLVFFLMAIVGSVGMVLDQVLGTHVSADTSAYMNLSEVVVAYLVAFAIIKWWNRKPVNRSLGLSSLRGRGMDLLAGLLVAAGVYAIGFGISLQMHYVTVVGWHIDWMRLGAAFLMFVCVAVAEEIMCRGFMLGQLLEAGMNRFVALFLSSILFAALHLFNPGMQPLPFVNIVLAGLMLGAVYLYTRNLWFPISLHLFWNFIQGPVLGYPVSGNSEGMYSVLNTDISTDYLMNGGQFGFEGSLICTILLVLLVAAMISVCEKNRYKEKWTKKVGS